MRPLFLAPLGVFGALALLLYFGLQGNPNEIPSALVGKPAPAFELAAIKGLTGDLGGIAKGLAKEDLMSGHVVILNVWASWCGPCRVEHPVLMELAQSGSVPIYGLNYKDKSEDALEFLDQLGNPYIRSGADITGRVGIDFGVYGVPETFVINGKGEIILKHVGPLTREAWMKEIAPVIEAARQQ